MRSLRKALDAAWGAAQIAAQIALGPVLHRWRTRWGATDAEVHRPLPGDDLVPRPDWQYTHAITVDAPRAAVWPWILRLGQPRGGIRGLRAFGVGPEVTELEPGRALVLGGQPDARGSRAEWSFHLVDLPDGRTRLIERGRNRAGRGLLAKLGFGPYLVDPIGFVMSRRLLRSVKRHAEAQRDLRAPTPHADPAPNHPRPTGAVSAG